MLQYNELIRTIGLEYYKHRIDRHAAVWMGPVAVFLVACPWLCQIYFSPSRLSVATVALLADREDYREVPCLISLLLTPVPDSVCWSGSQTGSTLVNRIFGAALDPCRVP